jgi:2,6-dihydroxypseudooxynicotine hydrolase
MTDVRLSEAIGHWQARFVSNGVDPHDYQRLAASISEWAGWLDAWSEAAAVHEDLGRDSLKAGHGLSGGNHLARAALYYHFAKFFWVQDMEEMRRTHSRAVTCLMDALPHLSPPGRRVEIPFETSVIVGVLRLPLSSGPGAIVILVPGLDSTKEELRVTEQLFLDRGLGTLAIDGPGQGEAEYDLPIRGDWEVPIGAVIDALVAMPEVEPTQIGIWGVSLGGYYAPRAASGDGRIKACVSLSGPYEFGTEWNELPTLTRDAFRVRSFSDTDEEARDEARQLSLVGRLEEMRTPLLVVAGRKDRIIPAHHAEEIAAHAGGPTELLLFEDGNHNCMNITYKHRPYSADWMADMLRV